MGLERLSIQNVRVIAEAELEPSAHLNVVTGGNGSGKTSLLEAIHILGLGRSFRTQDAAKVIRDGQTELVVFGKISDGGTHALGVKRSRQGTSIRIDGEAVNRLATLAEHLPLLVVTPQSHRLLEAGRSYRREYIDWGVFHVEPEFFPQWQRYRRALSQRNRLLKGRPRPEMLRPWTETLLEAGQGLDRWRRQYLEELGPYVAQYAEALLDLKDVELVYRPGWAQGLELAQALDEAHAADLERGFSTIGPHRAELRLRAGGKDLLDRVSRGQQKLLVYVLKLAQIHQLRERTGKRSVLLLDDLGAELDVEHRRGLLTLLAEQQSQVIVTATEPEQVDPTGWPDTRWFHVEQGQIRQDPIL